MEIATLILAAATVILSWNFLKELLTGVTKNTRRIIRGVDITTRGWLADASIEELEKATRYCAARGWSLKGEAEILAYWLAMDVAEAEVSQQKKLATELAAFLKENQLPAPTPTPQPTVAPIVT